MRCSPPTRVRIRSRPPRLERVKPSRQQRGPDQPETETRDLTWDGTGSPPNDRHFSPRPIGVLCSPEPPGSAEDSPEIFGEGVSECPPPSALQRRLRDESS